MVKKLVSFIMALSLILGSGVTAFAEENKLEQREVENEAILDEENEIVENDDTVQAESIDNVVSSMFVDKKNVTEGESVTITFHMKAGYIASCVSLYKPITKNTVLVLLHENEEGIYTGTFEVNDQTESGIWQVEYLGCEDNKSEYMSLYNSINYTGTSYEVIDFSDIEFEVTGTDADITPPVLRDYSIDKNLVSAGDKIKILAIVEDDNPISLISIVYKSPSKKNEKIWLKRIYDTSIYEGNFEISKDTELGNWRPYYIHLMDANRNSVFFYSNEYPSSMRENMDLSTLNFEVHDIHHWNEYYTIDEEPTCIKEGTKSIHCADCDKVKDVTSIAKVAHKYGDWIVDKQATCTEPGTKHQVCSVCGDIVTDIIEPLGHTEVIDEGRNPDCTTTGLTSGSHCSVCGIILNKQEKIPALGHIEVIDEAVPATEKENGLTEGKHCSVCGKILVKQQVIKSVLQYDGVSYTVNPYSSYARSNAITLESGEMYCREYSSNWHSRKWYSKFAIKDKSYALIGLTAEYYYGVKILDEDGVTVYDLGKQKDYTGYFPLKTGTYYLLLDNEDYSSNYIVLSYFLTENTYCECEPNDTFSMATELQPNQEYLIFSGQSANKDYLSFEANVESKVKIIVDNYELASPFMKLYESDRYTWTLINLKYDENIGKYYYEFIPKYKGTYYIETHSSKEEIVYGITIQFTEIAGWKKDEVGRWYQFLDGSYPVNCWKKINEVWYHFNSRGYMDTGWLLSNGAWYYLDVNGAMQTGWVYDNGKWYYMNTNGVMQTGWVKLDDDYYYFYGNGVEATNAWIGSYYLKSDGAMATSEWVQNGTYYVNAAGIYQTGWLKLEGKWYYLNGIGAKQTGWIQVGGTWYYGAPGTGALLEQEWLDNTYYFNAGGSMAKGWVKIYGVYYYFYSNGAKATNAWVGNYYLKADGTMAADEWVDGGKYYVDENGVWVANKAK